VYCRSLFIVAIACYGCGGATTPTSPTPPTAAAPAQPSFPSLPGHWLGSTTIRVDNPATGRTWTDHCELAMFITSQAGAAFSGDFASHGSGADTDHACERAGRFNGAIAENGTVTDLRFYMPFGDIRQCTQVSGEDTFAGAVSNGSSMTAQTSDRWACSGGGAAIGRWNCSSGLAGPTLECDRSLTVSVNKR